MVRLRLCDWFNLLSRKYRTGAVIAETILGQ